MRYMLIHCIDESAWSDPATPRPAGLPAYADWFREMDSRGVLLLVVVMVEARAFARSVGGRSLPSPRS